MQLISQKKSHFLSSIMIHNNSWNDYIKDFLLWLDFTNNIYFTKCKKCYKKAFMFFIFSIRKTCPDLWAILVPYFSSCLKRCEQMTMTLFLLGKISSISLLLREFKYSPDKINHNEMEIRKHYLDIYLFISQKKSYESI